MVARCTYLPIKFDFLSPLILLFVEGSRFGTQNFHWSASPYRPCETFRYPLHHYLVGSPARELWCLQHSRHWIINKAMHDIFIALIQNHLLLVLLLSSNRLLWTTSSHSVRGIQGLSSLLGIKHVEIEITNENWVTHKFITLSCLKHIKGSLQLLAALRRRIKWLKVTCCNYNVTRKTRLGKN